MNTLYISQSPSGTYSPFLQALVELNVAIEKGESSRGADDEKFSTDLSPRSTEVLEFAFGELFSCLSLRDRVCAPL